MPEHTGAVEEPAIETAIVREVPHEREARVELSFGGHVFVLRRQFEDDHGGFQMIGIHDAPNLA